MNRLQITSALVKAGWSKSDIDGLYDSGYSDEEIMEQAGLKDTKTAMTQVNDYAHWYNGEKPRNMYELVCIHDASNSDTYQGKVFCHKCLQKLLYGAADSEVQE